MAIISGGRVLACDTPANLKRSLRREAIFHVETSPLDGDGTAFLDDQPGLHTVTHRPGDGVSMLEIVLDDEDALGSVLNRLTERGLRLLNLKKREPTLEDVFVELVGRSIEEEDRGGG